MIFEALARHGDRPAIECADGTVVTYAELLARARRHVASGVVEVPADRSVDFIARCLGAWLCGGAFVPVDPSDPRPRPRIAHVDGLAYAIATSGSTGTPKHVLVSHAGLPALWRTQIDAFAIGPGARALWLHSPLFDASISDWGTALVSGATLVIPTANAIVDVTSEVAARAITHVDLPPSLLAHLDPPPSLRVVILGGEACDIERVRALARRVRVVVVYGPTEATVCSSLVVVDPDRWERSLIGHPLPGVTYQVIDGELWIGGDALAIGYTDPHETARRFLDVDGMRMYRTGDRVEQTAHGLAFIGRVDRQCKVAGRRVELDEIELALRRFVRDAAVIVHGERIVAFVDGAVDVGLDRVASTGFARATLRGLLPAWMVPSRVVVGPLPRTATGKIDRARLVVPPPAPTHPSPLALAWCQALGVDDVRDGDRFSEAGGDSLARLMFQVATDIAIEGDPTFGELVGRTTVVAPMLVRELERNAAERFDRLLHAQPRERSRIDARRTSDPGCVLFTGASGHLGRHLLRAWRRRDPRRIIALVRGPRTLEDVDGIELVRGDVGLLHLGLGVDAWCALVPRISAVVQCAATIALGGDYETHAPANVHGTYEMARLRSRGEAIAWHYMSTLSVFASTDRGVGRHEETARPDPDALAYGGYAQSKIAAEAIARACGASIYRLGLLVDRAPRPRDQLQMTIRALAKLGAVPAGVREHAFDVTPVDDAAEAIAALALRAEHARVAETHHLAGGAERQHAMTCGELADALHIPELPYLVWLERARARAGDPDVAMAIAAFSGRRDLDLFLATGADFATERTAGVLRELGITLRAVDVVRAALGGA